MTGACTRRALVLGAILFAASGGCAGLEARPGSVDGGEPRRNDGGLGGHEFNDGAPAVVDDGSVPQDRLFEDGRLDSCFDGLDNDSIAGADCDDPACATVPVCCVGSVADQCCTGERRAFNLNFAGCADGLASMCPAVTAAGSLLGFPSISAGALLPQSDARYDSGLVLGVELDPRTNVITVEGRIAGPQGCREGCIDTAGIALTSHDGSRPVVWPAVGVLVSGSLAERMLVVGGVAVWSEPLPDAAFHDYALTLQPDGRVILKIDGVEAAQGHVELPSDTLRAVFYGRSYNRGASDALPSRIEQLAVTQRGCDIPTALARGAPALTEPMGPPWTPGTARAPSIAVPPGAGPQARRLAFAASGSIWLAEPDGSGGFTVLNGPPALPADASPGGFADPELVPLSDAWMLLATAIDDEGGRRIVRVVGPPSFGEVFPADALRDLVRLPIDAGPSGLDGEDIVGLDGPSALDGDARVIAARAIRRDGRTAIVLLRGTDIRADDYHVSLVCGTGCEHTMGALTQAVHLPRESMLAFDHDEVASPALFFHDGVYRLYYAGRRGTRWSIGLLISDDLTFFRPANAGAPVLAGSGAGADAIGVSDPEVWVGAAGRLTLYYTGSDGAATRVLAAEQVLR